ncbi:MAG: hypothetical protein J1E96_04540 [Ruminococcus sp.]|nr:hypothetical protein [Ruminococcus sp.]
MVKTVILGQYREIYHNDELPSIFDNISDVPHPDKEKILVFMKSADVKGVSPAILTDVISGERIKGELCFLASGNYNWRSDITYYFEKYNLKLPDDFVERCVK